MSGEFFALEFFVFSNVLHDWREEGIDRFEGELALTKHKLQPFEADKEGKDYAAHKRVKPAKKRK